MTDLDRLTAALADRYRLERELGQGGMATVYLAEDLKHRRKVAIKVLHPELSAVIGPERFLNEIELTASLQHPHILPLFDSGAAERQLYYVMPFVDGETLRSRLTREKQLPVEDALRLAREVAAALEYAHKRGIVHRDIKPENILLQDGAALVADFGIALAVSHAGGGRMTQTGLSLGTPSYMSPEQAMGEREITARADVYALGAMTYEMLAGEPPFSGTSAQAIVAKVLTEEPAPITLRRKTVPAHVEAAVLTALQKLPADRFASAADFAAALVNPAFSSSSAHPTVAMTAARSAPATRSARLARIAVPLGAALAAALLTSIAVRRPAPPATPQRFALNFLPGQSPEPEGAFVLSPDGRFLAYVGPGPTTGTSRQVWIKPRDRWEAAPLAGTEGVYSFTFSPDGESLAFVQNFQLKRLAVTGGAAVVLADSVSGNPGIAWLDDGTIIYLQAAARELRRVPEVGGASQVVWADSAGPMVFVTPLPKARGVLLTRCLPTCRSAPELDVLDLRSGEMRALQPGALRSSYLPTGHVVYVRPDGAMMAVAFDVDRLEFKGTPVPVQNAVSVLDGVAPLYALANDGTLILRTGEAGSLVARYRLTWVDRLGLESPVDSNWIFRHTEFGGNAGWSLSPDGSRVAIGLSTDEGDDIWVKQLPDGPAVRVTFDVASEFRPRWLADGRTVMFSTNREAEGLYRRPADGTGADVLLLRGNVFEGQVTRDGGTLVARAGGQIGQRGGRNIGVMRLGTDTVLTPLLATQYDESEIALSPDGRWLAYVSDETGQPEVVIRPFPDVDRARYQVSATGGAAPLWSRDGRELFYLSGSRDMMAVSVAPGAELRLGERRKLFHLSESLYPPGREYYTPYDISPDGRRFLMARRVGGTSDGSAPLLMTLNWHEEVRARLGKK